MRIFLSWSGPQSKAAAVAFRDWLPYVINAVDPWMSARDIQAGSRWNTEIQSELEGTNFGILFVCKSNTTAPWLLFEAGALAKSVEDAYVVPLLLDLEPSELPDGPLSQFQSAVADEEGIRTIVGTINTALKDKAIPNNRLENAFSMWWPNLREKLDEVPQEAADKQDARSSLHVMEDILSLVRRIDNRDKLKFYAQPNKIERDLSQREIEVLTMVANGFNKREVANALGISANTAARHIANIYSKLEISSATEATQYAISAGVLGDSNGA